jgi:hypothetical protein
VGWSNSNRGGWGQSSGRGYGRDDRNGDRRGAGSGYGAPRGRNQASYDRAPTKTYQRSLLTMKDGQPTGNQYAVLTLDQDYRAGDQVRVKVSLCKSQGQHPDDGDVWIDVQREERRQRRY